MPVLKTIYETCRPRADVEAGTIKDEQFAADLTLVVNQSHQFLSPGGALFEMIASHSQARVESGRAATHGNVWLIRDESAQAYRFLARRGGDCAVRHVRFDLSRHRR